MSQDRNAAAKSWCRFSRGTQPVLVRSTKKVDPLGSTLHLLHQAVQDFSVLDDIQADREYGRKNKYSTEVSLLSSCVSLLKDTSYAPRHIEEDKKGVRSGPMACWCSREYWGDTAHNALKYAKAAQDDIGNGYVALLREMDHIATVLRERLGNESIWPNLFYHGSSGDSVTWRDSILFRAVETGLVLYVKHRVEAGEADSTHKVGRPLLQYAQSQLFAPPAFGFKTYPIEPLKILLKHGADPNCEFEGKSTWQLSLHNATHDFIACHNHEGDSLEYWLNSHVCGGWNSC